MPSLRTSSPILAWTGRDALDVGCGPGTLTMPLAPHSASAIAIDAGGGLWSTSFTARPLFSGRVREFDTDLRQRLLAVRPEGSFREAGRFSLLCARPRIGQGTGVGLGQLALR